MTTRQQRRAFCTRRLEAASVVCAAVFALVMCQLAPSRTADARTAPAGAEAGEVSRPAAPQEQPDARTGPEAEDGSADATADSGQDSRAADAKNGGVEPLPRSAPVRVRIAGTGIDAPVYDAARSPGGGPPKPPRQRVVQVAWDRGGAAPGEYGAAVLVGHRNSEQGPAAFAGLGGVRPGSLITVTRSDGRSAGFAVDAAQPFAASAFPARRVYAGTEDSRLRLVGYGGGWSEKKTDDTGIVVFAHLVSTTS